MCVAVRSGPTLAERSGERKYTFCIMTNKQIFHFCSPIKYEDVTLASDNVEDEHSQPFLPEVKSAMQSMQEVSSIYCCCAGSQANCVGVAATSRSAAGSEENSQLGSGRRDSPKRLQDLLTHDTRREIIDFEKSNLPTTTTHQAVEELKLCCYSAFRNSSYRQWIVDAIKLNLLSFMLIRFAPNRSKLSGSLLTSLLSQNEGKFAALFAFVLLY